MHTFGTYRRLLTGCTRYRLGPTSQEHNPSRPPTPGGTLHPAVIRARPVMALPPFYTRTSTTFEREVWKLEKEKFEKFVEAETILHTAIVESLSQGTIRTINIQHIAGISSLSALQLVEVVHQLYSTPTLQDITTVENDLKRPLIITTV